MQLNKGKYIATIKEPLFQLLEANIQVGIIRYALVIVRPYEIDQMLHKEHRYGKPGYLAMEQGQYTLTVYPIPDRRYQLELIGTRMVRL